MTIVLRLGLLLVTCFFFSACTNSNSVETIYSTLKEGQAKVVITIDGKPFYPNESIFSGTVDVSSTFFKVNLFDQFESNVIVGFNGDSWYAKRPIERPVFANNQIQASVMMGKITDKENRYGTGFLMTEGDLSVRALSEEKLIIHFRGKVGKYEAMREPQKWSSVEGDIVYRKPKINLHDLTSSAVYF